MRYIPILLLFLLTVHIRIAQAQGNLVNDDFNKSNEATSISRGHDDIHIPLFNIPFGGEEIPISISYQNEPPKYGQLPGLVGHSWNFSFQYHLTRSENLFEYERPGYPLNNPPAILDSQDKGRIDYYRFNTPGGSGTFLYNPNDSSSVFFSHFDKFAFKSIGYPFSQLTDNRGWKYVYGDTLVLDHLLDSAQLSRDMRLNASLLKQIIAPNRDTLTITYSRKKIYSPHKRIEITIIEPKDIAPPLIEGVDEATIDIDTLGMGEKYIYYPLYADHSNGDRISFYYSVTDTSVLLTSTDYLYKTVNFGYYTDRYATLLTSVNMNGDTYTMTYNTQGSDDNGTFDFKDRKLFPDAFGDYIYGHCDPPPCPENILSHMPQWSIIDYVAHSWGGPGGGLLWEDTHSIGPPFRLFYANKGGYPTFYMLSSLQNPLGGTVSYQYEDYPAVLYGWLAGPGYRLKEKIIKDTSGDTLSIYSYTYDQSLLFPYEENIDLYNENILKRKYIREGYTIFTKYRNNYPYPPEPDKFSLSRQFLVSNVPAYGSEEDTYMETQGIFHQKVCITTSDTKGIIGKKEYDFDIPTTISRNKNMFINYEYIVLGDGPTARHSYPSWPDSLDIGNDPVLKKEIAYTYEDDIFKPLVKKDYTYETNPIITYKILNWGNFFQIGNDSLPDSQVISDCGITNWYMVEAGKTNLRFIKKILRSIKTTNYSHHD